MIIKHLGSHDFSHILDSICSLIIIICRPYSIFMNVPLVLPKFKMRVKELNPINLIFQGSNATSVSTVGHLAGHSVPGHAEPSYGIKPPQYSDVVNHDSKWKKIQMATHKPPSYHTLFMGKRAVAPMDEPQPTIDELNPGRYRSMADYNIAVPFA